MYFCDVTLGLQNDFKALTKQIETCMATYHQQLREQGAVDTPMEIDRNSEETTLQPIAKVNLVSEGSPAFHAVRLLFIKITKC